MDKCEKNIVIIPAEEVLAASGKKEGRLRVAAYCRVSTEEERQLGSFENQIEYFTRLIEEKPGYELVSIYSDEGISGTSTRHRNGFMTMIKDCEAGKIDLIITKSISRFARNTKDSLDYTRKLKDMGIGIYFEKEGINTIDSSGELLLTLFSCFAQEESRSISENTAWGIRSKFQQGIPHLNITNILGYDKDENGKLVINEEQAAIVRRIYRCYLEGFSLHGIARALNAENIPGVRGNVKWCATTIQRLLENEKYKGDLLMQKTFTANYLTRQHVKNTGQLNQYYIPQNHPEIIPVEEWEAVQEEIARRRSFVKKHSLRGTCGSVNTPFYARIFCKSCGRKLMRIYHNGIRHPFWHCEVCGIQIEDEELRSRFLEAFNGLVEQRMSRVIRWHSMKQHGTPLEKVRARQMLEITAEGPIPFEIPELTRAVLEEAWINEKGGLLFRFLSKDEWTSPPPPPHKENESPDQGILSSDPG